MKKFLLTPRSYIIVLMIMSFLLFNAARSFAALKTWAGGTGAGKNWTTGANWGGTAPVAGDDIVFNTAGTITFSTMPGNVSYNSLIIQDGTVTFAHTSSMTLTIGSLTADPDFEIQSFPGNGSLILGTNVNLTLAAGASGNNTLGRISGVFTVNAGSTYNTDGSFVLTNVFGSVVNKGTITCTTASKLLMSGGGVYDHNQIGGNIPTATWDINSFCTLTGLTTTHPTGGNQNFGSLTYNNTGQTANITMTNGVSVQKDLTIQNTGGGSARVLMTAGNLTVGGNFNLNGNSNFTVSGTTDRTLTVSGSVFINSGNFDMCSGIAGNTGTVNVAGNFTNFDALTESGTGKGLINFNGTSAQTFNQSGAFVNVIGISINNAAGVTLSGNPITINDALTLTNGVLSIPGTATLTIANGNAIAGTGFGAGKHINTQVSGATTAFVRINNMAAGVPYLVPTGNGTYYLPATLTPTDVSSFSIGVFQGITEDGTPTGLAFTPTKKQGVVDAVWTINRNAGTLGTDMTLGWPAALEGSSFTTYTSAQIGISHYDGPFWGNCIGSGDNTLNTATRPGVTAFSPFSVGKTPYVLPVKFSYLNAAKGNGYNTLYWKAACSSGEATFVIERSADGRNFNAISSVTASQSRCAQPFEYRDNTGLSGNVFYRVKSSEITGVITYSNIVKLSDQQKDMLLVAVLPNPVTNQAQLNISTAQKDMVDLVIVSIEGKVLQHSTVQLQAGSSIINLDVANLQKGMYMIKGTFSNGQSNTIRFTKQ